MLRMRGFTPVRTIIHPESAIISRRKIDGSALLFLNGRRNGKKKRDITNFFTRQQRKYITISRVLQRRHHNSCVSLIVID
jgi:hypothetical protein